MNNKINLKIILAIILMIIVFSLMIIFESFVIGWIIIKILSLLNILKITNYTFWKLVLVGFLFNLIISLTGELFKSNNIQ